MPTAESRLSGWKVMLILVMFSTGVSVAVFTPTVHVVQQAGLDARAAVVPFTVITLLIHGLLFRNMVNRLMQITLALHYLHQNKPVTVLPVLAADVLNPLTTAVNALIAERYDLKTMRGQLVEQISAAAAQAERNRLARDLHDSIKQQVFSMSVSAAAASAHLDSNLEAARAALLDVKQSAQEAMVEMRVLLQQLSPAPLEKSGLIEALREQCEALAYRTGAQVETHFGDLPPDDRLPPGTQEALFRIAQEALSNIARHARAGSVRLTLGQAEPAALRLHIADDGQGFVPGEQVTGMGLNNIRTRAAGIGAVVELMPQPGAGTELTVTVPLIAVTHQESEMQAQYEAQLKPIIALYYRFAGGLAVFITAVSMLLWRLLARPEGIADDAVLTVILAGFIAAVVISLPFALWSWFHAHPQAAALILSAGRDSRTDYKLRRHLRLVYLVIALACAWFLPILAIGLGLNLWLRVALGVLFLGLAGWQYQRMGDLYQHELALMPVTERIEELSQRVTEVRSSWVTVLLMVVVVLISSLSGGEIQIPPQNPDHWMNVAFITLAGLLLVNQIMASVLYRRWRQTAEQQVEPA